MGNSVTADILTPDLTPERRKDLQALCDRFSYGTFDPMTDSSGYDRSDEGEAWELVHGRAKYCRIDFEQSEACKAAILDFLGGSDDSNGGGSEAYRVWSGEHCRSAEFWAHQETATATDTPTPTLTPTSYGIEKHHHSKRGFDFWLVVLASRVEREEFERLRDSCKAAGGWYSRKWQGTPGGFAFKEQEQAGAWAVQEFGGDKPTPPDGETKRDRDKAHEWPRIESETREGVNVPPLEQDRPKGTSKRRKATAGKLRGLADKLTAEIDHKRGDHKENTPKRQRQGMSRRIDADRLERTQQGLNALAALHEADKVPEALSRVTSKKAVFELLGTRTNSTGYYHVGDTHEPCNQTAAAVALWALIEGKSDEDKAAEELRQKVNGLQFSKIPGYFPTPPDLIADMLDHAQIRAGQSVLEPSAGSGAIADQLADLAADPLIVVNEINPTLCEILQAKGYDARPVDTLEENGAFRFDRVVMNPPFENLQDVDHVRHAFDRLAPGGRLVAIMSPAGFQRDTKKARAFRDWFDDLGGEAEEIEAGAFKESGTGVSAKLVVIDKPEGPKVTPQVEAIEGMAPLGMQDNEPSAPLEREFWNNNRDGQEEPEQAELF
jgi:protein-L-isoaspartate O-methyltransferase